MKKIRNKRVALKFILANMLFLGLFFLIIAVSFNLNNNIIETKYSLALLFAFSIIIYLYIRKNFFVPLKALSSLISPGEEVKKDEVHHFVEKHTLMQTNVMAATDFIKKIENEQLDEDYTGSADDELGSSLISMREHLKEISRQEKERMWISEGLAKFSDMLRASEEDIGTFCFNILSSLIKHINVNQGALFILENSNGSEEYMDMVACYAYSKKKHINKRVLKGQGLVGQVWFERDKVILSEVPQDYIAITSGLGDANPGCILIVPLKVNEDVVGVLEIASFKPIPEYQILFIEKLTESLASTISMVKVNEQTRKLLEESQEMTELMRSQEEEMRQNLEELSATQEELRRKEIELDKRLKEALAEIELGRVYQQMNEIALQIEHSIDSSTRDLKFLSNVPPVQGLVRAIENNKFDAQSNSSFDDWIERLDTIFRNFLINKELFQSIAFINEQGKVLYGLSFQGESLVQMAGNTVNYVNEDIFINTSKLNMAEVYVGQMKMLQEKEMVMEFGIPVFNEKKIFKAAILVNLFAETIIDGIISKEDGGNKFGLFTSEGVCIYGRGINPANKEILRKQVITNQKQNISLTIMHQ